MDLLPKLATIETNIFLSILYLFAIPHHLRTFFSPFKRMTYHDNRPGLSLEALGATLSYNLVSIWVGIVIRTIVIILGLACLAISAVCLLLFFIFAVFISPILIPILRLIRQNAARQLDYWKNQAVDQPGKILINLLKNSDEGRFLAKQLVLDNKVYDLLDTTAGFKPTIGINSLTDLFVAFAKDFAPFQQYLESQLMDDVDVRRIGDWFTALAKTDGVDWLDRQAMTAISGIGADWSYGYTNELDKYHLTQNFSQFPKVVGRDKEINTIGDQLSRSVQNSCLVYGEPGVGRHAVIDEFCRRLYHGQVNHNLTGFRTIYLDLKSAISGQSDMTATRKRALDLMEEGRQAGNVILVIDDIDKFFESAHERIDLTDIFNQTLSDGKLRIIGLTTNQLYDKLFATNSSLLKLFSPVKITQPDIETVYTEMELSIVPILEKQHFVSISYASVKEAITNADRFVSNVPFPEKAINILDEAVTAVKAEHPHMKQLWKEDVSRYLSAHHHLPTGPLSQSDEKKLANLEDFIHKRIVGQDTAVEALAKAMRRSVLSVSARNKPIGTFLFLGPTGVGKTETAKALAQAYFGDEKRMIRLDMSEFQGEEGEERLIGSSKTNQPGQLTAAISDNPFSVVLLDEIEKSPPVILNLFLTLLDEGYITDVIGRKISARQNIIIATSNAGALYIRDQIKKGVKGEALNKTLLNYILEQKIFSPEFINRFDGVVVFEPLTQEQIALVARRMLEDLNDRLREKKLTLSVTDDLVNRLAAKGFDPVFGARAMRRYVQDQIEDEIAKKILSEKTPPGSTIEL